MISFHDKRAIKIIKDKISEFEVDLSGKEVLTEIGSSYYSYLPLICSLSKAKIVHAFVKDSIYGIAENIVKDFSRRFINSGEDLSSIVFHINTLNKIDFKKIDILTNSAPFRPINEKLLNEYNDNLVVALMYDRWELRAEDIDIEFCRSAGIKIAGVNENHHKLNVFCSVGNLIQKLIYEAGLELWNNNILIWSNDEFGVVIKNKLIDNNNQVFCTTDINKLLEVLPILDIIILSDYFEDRNFISESGILALSKLLETNNAISIIHLFGEIDAESLLDQGINVYPRRNGMKSKMSFTLGHLGPRTIISLQVAGLKAADLLHNNSINNELMQIV